MIMKDLGWVRARRGRTVHRKRKRRGKKYSFAISMTNAGLLHPPYLIQGNFDDDQFMEYVEDMLVPKLESGMVVFWDRLGKSGRKKHPVVQHFNPRAKKLIQEKNCKLVFLPPYGKYFNPCELVNSFLKSQLRKVYTSSPPAVTQRARTFRELQKDLEKASQKITPDICAGFFRERANGRAFKNRYGLSTK